MFITMRNGSYNKYSNTRTVVDNLTFASKREATRYSELKLLQRAGEIKDLKLQAPFILQEGFIDYTGKTQRPIKYIADFMYLETKRPDMFTVEDCKGHRTKEYLNKRKLFLYKFPNIRFIETWFSPPIWRKYLYLLSLF